MNKPFATVRFVAAQHREKAIIKIVFDYNPPLIERVKRLPGAAWSQTMTYWYVPDTEAYRARFGMDVKIGSVALLQKMCGENEMALLVFVKELQLKGYSRSTIATYRKEFVQLLQTMGKVPVNTLTRERLRDYFIWCHAVKKLTENTLHSRLNAVVNGER